MTDEAPKKKRGRKPGTPKTGGRVKGTRNLNSHRFLQAMDQAGIHLVELLIMDIAMLDPPDRVAQYRALMRYAYPRLKSVEQLALERPPQAPQPAATTPQPKPAASPASRLATIRGNAKKANTESGQPG